MKYPPSSFVSLCLSSTHRCNNHSRWADARRYLNVDRWGRGGNNERRIDLHMRTPPPPPRPPSSSPHPCRFPLGLNPFIVDDAGGKPEPFISRWCENKHRAKKKGEIFKFVRIFYKLYFFFGGGGLALSGVQPTGVLSKANCHVGEPDSLMLMFLLKECEAYRVSASSWAPADANLRAGTVHVWEVAHGGVDTSDLLSYFFFSFYFYY